MQYNKTIIASVGLICLTVIVCVMIYITGNVKISNNNVKIVEANIQSVVTKGTDKFTHCLQIVMSEARQGGKPIDGTTAKNVCTETVEK